MFFGTNKKVSYIDENSTFSYDDIIRINGEFPPVDKSKAKVADKERNKNGIDLFEEIRNYNFYSFLEKECGKITRTGSNYTMFYECPICNGHAGNESLRKRNSY